MGGLVERKRGVMQRSPDGELDLPGIRLLVLGLGVDASNLMSNTTAYTESVINNLPPEIGREELAALLSAVFVDGFLGGCIFTEKRKEEDAR